MFRAILSCMLACLLTSFAFAQISFQLINNLIIVRASVKGRTGSFILDTGVSDVLLNRTHFPQARGWKIQRDLSGATGAATGGEVLRVIVQIGDISKNINAELVDLRSLEKKYNIQLLGLVGVNFFLKCELIIDYHNRIIDIYQLGRSGERSDSVDLYSTADEIIPFRWSGHLACITASINNRELLLALDTGAGVNLFDQSTEKILQREPANIQGRILVGLGGQRKPASSLELADLQVGNIICQPMNTFLYSLSHLNHKLVGPAIDGLLGSEFLKQFRTVINFKQRKIYLWKVDRDFASR